MDEVIKRKYGVAGTFYITLKTAGSNAYQANPTLATGDVKISKDGGPFANIATLPVVTPASGIAVKVSLSAAELTSPKILIQFIDAAGAEWDDYVITVETYGNASSEHAFDLDTATQGVNVTQISGDSTAADNLELQYDTTGLAGGTFPANQNQLGGLANVGSASNRPAVSYTLTTGTQSVGTYTNTEALDEVFHAHTDDTGVMDLYYEFNIGSGSPSSAHITGYLTGVNDTLGVYGYDWVASSWVQIGSIVGKALAANEVNSFDMFVNMVGTGANIGVVRVRAYAASGLTTATLAIDQIFVSFSAGEAGYVDGIEVDTNASNTSTTPGIDGVKGNPVSTWAAALTLRASTGIHEFKIINGSSITLTANSDNYTIKGQSYSLALGGQSAASIYVFGADITGTATGAGMVFEDCPTGNVSLPPSVMRRCFPYGTITNTAAGDWFINDPRSRIAGSGSPIFDFGTAVGNTNLNIRGNSGGWQLESMGDAGTDVASVEGWGQIIEGTCTGGTVTVRGNFTTSGITNLTLSDDARVTISNFMDEVLSKANYNIAQSLAKLIRDSAATSVQDGEVNDASATTFSFVSNLTKATDDFYNDSLIIFTSGNLEGQTRPVLDYIGSSKTIVVDEAWSEVPADTDEFVIVSDHIHPLSQIREATATSTIKP